MRSTRWGNPPGWQGSNANRNAFHEMVMIMSRNRSSWDGLDWSLVFLGDNRELAKPDEKKGTGVHTLV
jgi:hypothetical protein